MTCTLPKMPFIVENNALKYGKCCVGDKNATREEKMFTSNLESERGGTGDYFLLPGL